MNKYKYFHISFRLSLATLLILTIAISLSGCGDNSNKEGNVIRFWHFWQPELIEPAIKEFEAENPGWSVAATQLTWGNGLEKINVSLAGGTPPDLCELGSTWTSRFIYEDVLQDLTEDVAGLKDDLLMWEPVRVTETGTSEEIAHHYYGLPWLVGTRAMFYNRELFKKAGLNPDVPPATWGEVLQAAEAVNLLDKNIFGFGVNAGERHVLYKKILPFIWSLGGNVLDEKGNSKINSPEALEALNFYLALAEHGLKEKQEALDSTFKDGRLGMMISGSWNLSRIPKDAPDIDFGVSLVPAPGENRGSPVSFAGAEMLVIFKNSKVKHAALKLAQKLISAEHAMAITRNTGTVFPADRKAESAQWITDDPGRAIFAKQLQTSAHPPIHPKWVEIQDVLDSAFEAALLKQQTPEKALEDADNQIRSLLEDK